MSSIAVNITMDGTTEAHDADAVLSPDLEHPRDFACLGQAVRRAFRNAKLFSSPGQEFDIGGERGGCRRSDVADIRSLLSGHEQGLSRRRNPFYPLRAVRTSSIQNCWTARSKTLR